MNKNIKSILKVSASVFFLFLLIIFFHQVSCQDQSGVKLFGSVSDSPLKNSKEVSRAEEVQDSFRKIFELYKDRVVFISTEQTVKLPQHPFFNDPFFREFFGNPGQQRSQTQKRTGLGSGFILSEDGYICTNYHVVAKVDKVKVKINKTTYDAKIVGTDERTDIALLKIDPKVKLKPVFLGNSDEVKVGDWSIAIGNPFGLEKSFTLGVVSATGR